MGTGQIVTVIVALVLLGVVSLRTNTMMLSKSQTMYDSEASLDAVSYAQTLIDEIMTKSFDAVTITQKVFNASDFTSASGLGPNASEAKLVPLPDSGNTFNSIQNYNDVDDYNGYQRKVTNSRMGTFTLNVGILYVSETKPDQQTSSQTFFKKIVVTVTQANMSKPLFLSDIAIYRRYF